MTGRALLVGLLLLAGGCALQGEPLADFGGGFDPTRWDPGPEPAWDGPKPTVVRFGVPPDARGQPALAELRDYLSQALSVRVEIKVGASVEDTIGLLQRGEVDCAQLPPYLVVMAERRMPDLVLLATGVAQGSSSYASYLVTTRTSPLRSVEEAKGLRLAFVDELSASGYLYPALWLKDRGMDPATTFAVTFTGSQEQALQALLDGEVDLAAMSSDTLVGAHGAGLSGPVRILAKAGRIPYDAIVVRRAASPALKARLQAAFLRLSVHTERGRRVLEHYNLLNGFMPVPKGHYDDVREHARRLVPP